ncbi:hypothetical protein, conserved [Trypanosoma brucei brucei TREU927]|uniref:Uncharacterized protein n=1 Tax=Trypanosoma brucei brucei (strain 927/4 GUTat10.1) TaxID=185431 RepID=Q389U7_TRYB2|nr:hypothetical protein, conserved [Trypanosoma brucei brucei TREU927]EAN78423.1 hypothetical protein, conserved [Trypanosoma brucei brucei TREU927]
MSWMSALRSYIASPPHIKQRTGSDIFRQVARAHLLGPLGHTIHPCSVLVLRRLRWEIMRYGTSGQKAQALETILACYGDADRAHAHDAAGLEASQHMLTLEQLQCVVEAQVMGIPLRADHYRFLFQSSQLSQLGVEVPLLLLKEVQGVGVPLTDDALVDFSVGLTSSGHWREALQVLPRGHLLELVERVASVQRQGWRRSCSLVAHVKENNMVGYDEDTCNAVLSAHVLQWKAVRDPFNWEQVNQFVRVFSNTGRPWPRRALHYYLLHCPTEQWRQAVELVRGVIPMVENISCQALGRLMALLNEGCQWESSLFLYQRSSFSPPLSEQRCVPVQNQVLIALAKGGLWKEAVAMYTKMSARNNHTYTLWLNVVLLEGHVPFAATWRNCVEAYRHAPSCNDRFAVAMAYDLGKMGNWLMSLTVAQAAPKWTSQVLPIAIAAAVLSSGSWETVWQIASEFALSRHVSSVKQTCAVLAIIACCTRDPPSAVSGLIADALHSCVKSQRQFDESAHYMSKYMALLLHPPTLIGTKANLPPAISLLLATAGDFGNAKECWVFALSVMQSMSAKGWSLAAVAPVMLSSGFDASVAIHFLPA